MQKRSTRANAPTVWFEVEDLIRHFDWAYHPGGMHRVCLELLSAAEGLDHGDIRFCRLSSSMGRFYPVDFETILAIHSQDDPGPRRSLSRIGGLFAATAMTRRVFRLLSRRFFAWLKDCRPLAPEPFKDGDALVVIGSAWDNGRYVEGVKRALGRYQLRLVVLIHDIIPLTSPEFVPKRRIAPFRDWFLGILPLAERLLTSSEHCRSQIMQWCDAHGFSTPAIDVVCFGDGFSRRPNGGRADLDNVPDSFVLFVSTIEIRKNHKLLVRLWEQLIESHSVANVPPLVWIGDRGWLVDDLFEELEARNYLDGKIMIFSDLSDAELCMFYERCAFTIYPSWCEGWGLPVGESLSFGKLCIASNRTSLPEVGGSFADYFDPADDRQALAAVERALFEPGYLEERNRSIQDEFHPRSWAECARAILRLVATPPPAHQESRILSDRSEKAG